MRKSENESSILVTTYSHGFDSKQEAMENIELIQSYLDQANIKNNSQNRVVEQLFNYKLKNGVPHAMGSWKFSERKRSKIKRYQANCYCFNLNDLSSVPPESLSKVISRITNGPFRFIQESFSSGDTLAAKKYHLYLPVTELEDVDFEVQQLIYEWVLFDLEINLGVQLDESTYLHKNILASRNKVQENENAPIFDLKPYLNKFKRIENVVKKRDNKVSNEEVIQKATEEEFKAKKINSTVNFKELLKAFSSEGFSKNITYKERGYLFMVLNNLEEMGQITEVQKIKLAKVLCNE